MLLLGLAFLLAACGDEDEAPPPPPTAVATATATPFPPVDGTVPAQGTGGTDPVDIKSNPDPVSGAATLVDVRVGAHPEQGGGAASTTSGGPPAAARACRSRCRAAPSCG